MSGGIYLVRGDDELVEMRESRYDSEDLLQTLIEKYPALLAGEQMTSEPRRWMLVAREAAVPSEEKGNDRWSVDHLFLDQEGVPTLIEVKRSTDTRIRREVVGQMLDYAANAVVYWPIERIRASFEKTCERQGRGSDTTLRDLIGMDVDPDLYWEQVSTNLKAGKVRMVFVADEIPSELRRIVEFLNTQMNPAEVLAVEIKQFTGQGLSTLVPRVLGQTAEAQQRKGRTESRKLDEASFLAALTEGDTDGASAAAAAMRIIAWTKAHGLRQGYGQSSFQPTLDHSSGQFRPVTVYTGGGIEVPLRSIRAKPPFNEESLLDEYRRRIELVPGVSLNPDQAFPQFKISLITSDGSYAIFESALDWFADEVRRSSK